MLLAALGAFSLLAPAAAVENLPTTVGAKDPNIRYVGRWDMADASGPTAAWTASEVAARFKGTAVNAKLAGSGYYQVVVDGQPKSVIAIQKDQSVYQAAAGLENKEHTIQIVRRNEAAQGSFTFQGFQLETGGTLLPLPPQGDKRILVIGDSISCGYGNEHKGGGNPPAKQNGYMTYGPIAARNFGAEVQVVAWSGRKLWPNNTMVELYDSIYPGCKTRYDLKSWVPGVVVIDLGTNDFAHDPKNVPDEKGWTGAAKAFIKTIRQTAPEAHVFLATGPMWIGAQTAWNKYVKSVVKDLNDSGDAKVHYLAFDLQDINKDGMGGDWHPNVKTHIKMAAKLTAAIEKEAGWKAAAALPAGVTFGGGFVNVKDVGPEFQLQMEYDKSLYPVPASPAAGDLPLRINVGGKKYTDPRGNVWKADKEFSNGSYGYSDGEQVDRGSSVKVGNTDMQRVFRDERYGLSAYKITVPAPGKYTLALLWAETFEDVSGPGERSFNVTINNKTVLRKFDPAKEAGGVRKAVARTFVVEIPENLITIGFKEDVQSPMLNGIVVMAGEGDEVKKAATAGVGAEFNTVPAKPAAESGTATSAKGAQ
jgi:lysophospholipase L1-like esterase